MLESPRCDYRPIIAGGYRRGSLRLFWRICGLPLAQSSPALVVCAAQDGGVAHGYAVRLRFVDNAIIERHGLWRGFVNAGVMKRAFIQNGHGKHPRGHDAGRISGDLNHGRSPQLVRFAPLRHCRGESRSTHQHKHRAGQEPASAI